MSLVVACRKCGCEIRAKGELLGKAIRCPNCGTINRLPGVAVVATADPATGVCPVCGFDLWVDPDQVQDYRGRRFHRACFKEVRTSGAPQSADSDVVQVYQAPGAKPSGGTTDLPSSAGEDARALPDKPAVAPEASTPSDKPAVARGEDELTLAPEPQSRRAVPPAKPTPPRQASRSAGGTAGLSGSAASRPKPARQPPPAAEDDLPLAIPLGPTGVPDREVGRDGIPSYMTANPSGATGGLDDLLGPLPDALPVALPAGDPFAAMPKAPANAASGSSRQPLWLYLLIGFGAAVPVMLLVYGIISATTKPGREAAKAEQRSVQQSDPALLDKLGLYQDVNAYQIRLPRGSQTELTPTSPPGCKIVSWTGAERSDGTHPSVLISVGPLSPRERGWSAERIHANYLGGMKSKFDDWQQQPTQSVEVNGLPFLKTTSRATLRGMDRAFHGIQYGYRDKSCYVEISAQDVEPHHAETLKLLEASVLTFRKNPDAAASQQFAEVTDTGPIGSSPEPDSRDVAHQIGYGAVFVGGFLCVAVVGIVVGSFFLLLAGRIAGVPVTLGKSMAILGISWMTNAVTTLVLSFVASPTENPAIMLLPVVITLAVMVASIAGMVPTSFGKAVLMVILYFVVIIGVVVLLALLLPALIAIREATR